MEASRRSQNYDSDSLGDSNATGLQEFARTTGCGLEWGIGIVGICPGVPLGTEDRGARAHKALTHIYDPSPPSTESTRDDH